VWTSDDIRHELKKLVDRSCEEEVLLECATLLALPPVQSVVQGKQKPLRAYILREFLRAVVDGGGKDDLMVRAAGALVGTASRPNRHKYPRQKAAGEVLHLAPRTIRQRYKETQLVEALANAIIDFVMDDKSVGEFVRTHQLQLESRNSGKQSSESIARKIDIVGELLNSAQEDPVARSLFDQIAKVPHSTDPKIATEWRSRFESHYRMRARAKNLCTFLQSAVQAKREKSWLWEQNRSSFASSGHAELLLFHAALNIFILRHGGLWVLNDVEVERQICKSIHRLYVYSPFDTTDDGWLRLLLAREQVGKKLKPSERAHTIPDMPPGPDVDRGWQQFLSACNCKNDTRPSTKCRVHALIRECNRYSELVERLLIRQLSGH
jgi:hypothetical protein